MLCIYILIMYYVYMIQLLLVYIHENILILILYLCITFTHGYLIYYSVVGTKSVIGAPRGSVYEYYFRTSLGM